MKPFPIEFLKFLNWKRCMFLYFWLSPRSANSTNDLFLSREYFLVNKKKTWKSVSTTIKKWILNLFFPPFSIKHIFRLISTLICFPGSLPPSPADSGVSDVDSSSSGNGQPICSDELKARLGLSGAPTTTPNSSNTSNHSGQQQSQLPAAPPGAFLHPNFYHQSAPLRTLWNNRNVSSE